MALINTYTATKCGPTEGASYQVSITAALLVPAENLAAVRVSTSPDTWVCCVIDRSQVNQTEEKDVKPVQNSEFALEECQACQAQWSS